ncbi:MAG TPA: DivIVA domain-containing protein [Jatrophihabitans sp.]|jgi:DivIVA domain-containing protein
MPLTPAEVHNVAFKKPPIGKRGYDEEEVDAFLDIVEVELARLIEENNDLRARANGSAPPQQQGAPVDDGRIQHAEAQLEKAHAELNSAHEDNQRMQSQIGELERALSSGNDGAQQQVVHLQQQLAETEQQLSASRQQLEAAQQALADAQTAAASSAAAPQESGTPNADHHLQAVQMLALAQQTADQHLAQSKAEAERLLAEAQRNHEETVGAAQEQAHRHVSEAESRAKQLDEESTARADRTVKDAEQRAATITAQFEQRKAALERRVEELRTFEREYRTRLKSYLESQLRDLDASGNAEPAQNEEMADAQN